MFIGALRYFIEGSESQESAALETQVILLKNGPLHIIGTVRVKDKVGKEAVKNKTTTFCRCAASNNKHYL
ncbi:MAG: hypothetical protein ACJAXX_000197 [Roseivirga sp.]|jgi:hypothetical protein